ncbi:MAG: prenyltransferase/squalene oxidase repeat-containing protein [Solirubrobacteraceae bacterium]
MSWQVGAFGLLAVALGAGFAWYERERPDARIVALVGTLAAFAALGRIAFAAVPNVKPTTDIVLIAGFALGGAPGFAVGALAALTSNFFFGQGPWTPWQMAAWAATGVLGATLAWGMRTRARAPEAPPLGRWPLAIVCGAAGFAFTVLQDVGDWVSFSDHSLAQLGVYVGQGLGFDAIHAAGCVAFALALGPALTRSIQRFARRTKVTWVPLDHLTAPVLAAALVLGALGMFGSRPEAARAAAVSPASLTAAASNYLLGSENADGGFGAAPHQPSDQLYTGWTALGLAAAGHDLNRVGDAAGLMDYVRAGAGTHDVVALERTILVVRAAGLSARSFGGRDLVAALNARFRADGSISGQVNLTAFAVLALRAAADGPAHPTARPLRWLIRQQDRDGGFSFSGAGGASDVDDTGAALEALAGDPGAAGVSSRAVTFLRHQQNRDGGFPSQPGMDSNAQSTAWAIQGLDAAGVSPAGLHRGGAVSPLAYLDSLVAANGAVRYARRVSQTPVWVTGEALMAMEGKPLPVAAPPAPAAAPSAPAAPAAAARPGRRARPTRSARHRSAAPVRPAERASAHTNTRSHGGPAPRNAAAAAIARNQVLAGDFARAVGVVTALVLAPVGLG